MKVDFASAKMTGGVVVRSFYRGVRIVLRNTDPAFHLMRILIRIRLFTSRWTGIRTRLICEPPWFHCEPPQLPAFDFDGVPYSAFDFDADLDRDRRIRFSKMTRTYAGLDPDQDPQHWI